MGFVRFEAIHAVTHTPYSRTITATMDDLSELMARSFTLTSKEDKEVEAGEEAPSSGSSEMKFDLVGRVVAEKSYSAHTLQLNIERSLRPVRGFSVSEFGG